MVFITKIIHVWKLRQFVKKIIIILIISIIYLGKIYIVGKSGRKPKT